MPRRKTTEEFIQDAIKVHKELYDYSKVKYKNSSTKVIIICKKHGEFGQRPSDHLQGKGCSKCGKMKNKGFSTKQFIEKAIKVHCNKYDYSKVEYKNCDTRVNIICKIHGIFTQTPYYHLTSLSGGCSKCSGNYKYSSEEWIEKAKELYGDKYDYSKVNYIGARKKIIIICKSHGEFKQEPSNHLNNHGCPKCANNLMYSTREYIKKAEEIHGKRYDYSNVTYCGNKIKIKIKCIKHNFSFLIIPSDHLNGTGCSKCSGNYIPTTEEWIEKAKETHGNKYDYTKSIYKKNDIQIIIICKNHGEFKQIAYNHINGSNCPKCIGKYNYNTEEWIEKAKEIHGNKYDYSKVKYLNSKTKVTLICKDHGEFQQVASNHLNLTQGCPYCGYLITKEKLSLTNSDFINKAIETHGKRYDYSKIDYKNSKTKVIIICKKHGEFKQRASDHIKGSGCSKCQSCPKCLLWMTHGKLCQYCKPKNKNKLYQKTKEYAVVKFLREKLPDYDFIHNKSVGSHCTKEEKQNSNGHLFPDILFDCGYYHLIVEVDEHKHRGANYKCDKQRMYDIIAKLGLPCIFIRYNPDNKNSNKKILLKMVKKYIELEIDDDNVWDEYGFKVKYLFY